MALEFVKTLASKFATFKLHRHIFALIQHMCTEFPDKADYKVRLSGECDLDDDSVISFSWSVRFTSFFSVFGL
jgi:hypothetical protein